MESFLESQKSFPMFSKKTEIMGFLKHVSFSEIHRDFFKPMKKTHDCSLFVFLKKNAKKSLVLFPEDVAEISSLYKNYKEVGLYFEKEEK